MMLRDFSARFGTLGHRVHDTPTDFPTAILTDLSEREIQQENDRVDLRSASRCGPPADAGGKGERRVRFVDLCHSGDQRAKVLRREAAVLRVKRLQLDGNGVEMALKLTSGELRDEGVRPNSVSAIRSWITRYDEHGLDGLVEQKQGVVGQRAVEIPEEIRRQACAASIEYGTLGRQGRQNFARSFREVIVNHPDATPEMRERYHGCTASKSHVPPSVRRALSQPPAVRDLTQGPKAARLNSPYTPCDWAQVKSGRVVTGDDMTCNVYCWVEFPNAQGFIVLRPQLIALLDCGSLRWLLARIVVRPKGQYNSDDVWGVIGDLADSYGIYPEFLFEGGIWRSNKVRGERTGISDDDRFGGLRTFGSILRHAHTPRAKPIEERFNQLQYAGDRLPGYAGRNERQDCPEATRKILAAIEAKQLHPRGQLLHLSDLRKHFGQIMEALNNERQDGVILRGMCPNEKWAMDDPKFPIFPTAAKWLYRSTKNIVNVRRDGQLRIVVGSGKFATAYLYRSAEVLLPISGRKVVVYWNLDHPEADCIVLDAATRKFLGACQYVNPIPRFDGKADQFEANGEQLKSYRMAVRTAVVDLAPEMLRQQVVPVDESTEENGRRLIEAEDEAKSKRTAKRRVERAVNIEVPADLRDFSPRAADNDPTRISEARMAELIGDHALTT